MKLVALVLVPLLGGLCAWPLGRRWARIVTLLALAADLVLALSLLGPAGPGGWLATFDLPWIPALGVGLRLGLDGLSLVLVLLTLVVGILSVLASWTEIRERVGFFHFNLCWVLAGILGVFLALDLFLFYFLWELMLVPMVFLIALWGHERRTSAAIKFFLFTQASGLLMLLAILGLALVHHRTTGAWSFAYAELLGTELEPALAFWLMLGFFAAFAVKLPVVVLHTWLPDAHSQAPTAGSVVLAALLLKTGAYGLLRFAIPLFPEASARFAPFAMALGAIGVLYGAILAFAQTDLKRLVAYTSVSHLGFVLLGIYAWTSFSLAGTVMQMVAHGLSTGGLFVLAGALYERAHTRELDRLGGLAPVVPRMGAAALFFALASLGLPGLGNFVAEFLVLAGAWQVRPVPTTLAAVGLVAATLYSLRFFQRAFHGPPATVSFADLGPRELTVLGTMGVALLWLGLDPQPLFDVAGPALDALMRSAGGMP